MIKMEEQERDIIDAAAGLSPKKPFTVILKTNKSWSKRPSRHFWSSRNALSME